MVPFERPRDPSPGRTPKVDNLGRFLRGEEGKRRKKEENKRKERKEESSIGGLFRVCVHR